MLKRCSDPSHPKYPSYGGRGIKVWPPWRKFHVWAKAVRPRPKGASIDRIDNDKGYRPGNVRWATPREQSLNMRSNAVLESDGKAQPLSAWAREKGINKNTLQGRIARGMSHHDAVNAPVNSRPATMSREMLAKIVRLRGEGMPVKEIAKVIGRHQTTINRWLRRESEA
jgi:transposase-like protein